MNNPDHISQSLETIFWVKILKSLMRIQGMSRITPVGQRMGGKLRGVVVLRAAPRRLRLNKFGSGINIPDQQHWLVSYRIKHTLILNYLHISKSFETNSLVKILKFFYGDPGSGIEKFGSQMEKIRIRDKHPGSATLITRTVHTIRLTCLPHPGLLTWVPKGPFPHYLTGKETFYTGTKGRN